MDDLVSWLEAQIAEDERAAQAATAGAWSVDDETYPEYISNEDGVQVVAGGRWGGEGSVFETKPDALHIAAWGPARVLAECEAKRLLIELASGMLNEAEDFDDKAQRTDALTILRGLGALYAKLGRPGYQESWRRA